MNISPVHLHFFRKQLFVPLPFLAHLYSNDVASVVVRQQGTFRNRQGYFNETWCEDTCTFGQYAQMVFFIFAILPILWPPGGHLENQTFANGCT
jgi:hypothetical protein